MQVLKRLQGIKCLVDYILVIVRNQDRALYRIVYRKKASLYGKCVYSVSKLKYLGLIIDGQGIRNDPCKVEAVVDFLKPRDVAEFRWFLSVLNQRTKFFTNLAVHTKPPRDLLRTNTAWLWPT